MNPSDAANTTNTASVPLDTVMVGDCVEVMGTLPDHSVDMIYADPPYFLRLKQSVWRPHSTLAEGVRTEWDTFPDRETYVQFTRAWLSEVRRLLNPERGSLWVSGMYHNIYLIGNLLQEMGFYFINDIVWIKTNPMPNFRGTRFTNAHEIILWVTPREKAYHFHYHAMKALNGGKQMRSDWVLPVCGGTERLKINGKSAHPTQKPEALLYRVVLASTKAGDTILDPFFGTGTSGAVAKKLHRHWIGIEKSAAYAELARRRIESIRPELFDEVVFDVEGKKRKLPRVPFGRLLEVGLVMPGECLYLARDPTITARVKPDGRLRLDTDGFEGSIHQVGNHALGDKSFNGWEVWAAKRDGRLVSLDSLRHRYRAEFMSADNEATGTA